MRIAQIVSTYPPYRGGMGTVAREYASRLRQRGIDVETFVPETPGHRRTAETSVRPVRAPVRWGNAAFCPGLFSVLEPFDIVHVHYPFFGGAEAAWLRAVVSRRQRLVLTYQMDAAAGGIRGAMFSAYERAVFPWLARRADRILASSGDYAAHSALARLDGIRDRVEIHPPGVDVERFHPGRDDALRRWLGIPEAAGVILFVGALDRAHDFKGLPNLLRAAAAIADSRWHLVVVGDGDRRAVFESLAETLGVARRVTFAGHVSDDDLPRYYRMADLHVLPSTSRTEALGLVTMEASASGIPSIVTNLPGVCRTVEDGTTGVIVEPGDVAGLERALRRLLHDPAATRRLGGNARLRAEREWGWAPAIARLEDLYRRLLA